MGMDLENQSNRTNNEAKGRAYIVCFFVVVFFFLWVGWGFTMEIYWLLFVSIVSEKGYEQILIHFENVCYPLLLVDIVFSHQFKQL